MTFGADEAEEWVRAWSASISGRAAAAQEMSDRVAALLVSASDRDHTVTVSVDGAGGLVDLRLEPGAAGHGMERLAELIMQTMRRAQADLAERVAGIVAQTLGAESESARAVVSSFRSRFPSPADPDDGP